MSQTRQQDHLLRRPGRPKRADAGYAAGTPVGRGSERGAGVPLTRIPRLLDLDAAAAYLGISP